MSDIEKTMNDPAFIGPLVAQREELQLFIAGSSTFNSITELRDLKLDLIQEVNQIDIQILFNSIVSHVNDFGVNQPAEAKDAAKRRETLRIITQMLYPAMKNFYMKAYVVFAQKQTVYQSIVAQFVNLICQL